MSLHTTQSNVFINPEPFTPRVEKLNVAPGRRVVDLLVEACNSDKLNLDDLDRVLIYVNGELLEEDALDYVTQVGDVINIAVEPLGGGKGDGNKVMQTVLTLAVIAVSFWVGGPAGPLAAVEGLKGTVIRAAAAAAVNVGGSMAINAIFRPDQDQLSDANDKRTLQDQQNQYRPRGSMPIILGKRRVAFDLAAKPYTQFVGEDSWLHIIYGIHYGKCQVEDIKIGETLLVDYPAEDIQIEYFLEPGQRDSQIYPGRVIQENLQDELEIGGPFEVHTSATNPDRIEVDLTWPGGLRYNKDNGKILPQETQLLIEWSPAGQNTWTPAPTPPATNRLGQVLPTGSVYVQARTNDPVRRTVGWEVPNKQQHDVRIRAWDPDGDDPDTVVQTVYWTALRTIERVPPIVDQTLAIIAVRIKASDDLNGTLPLVTGVVTPIVPIWSNGNWGQEAPTSNAAALARWVMCGDPAAVPLNPVDEIHSSIVDAYELIEEHEWEGSLEIRSEMSQEDVLNALGRMGRFSTYYNGSKLCFVTDWEKPAARQLFSGLNAQGYRYKRVFPNDIHAVLVEFSNADKDWLADELWVYNDGYDESNAELFETLRLDYACTMDKAYRDGRVYLAKRKLQVESHEWTAGADAIVSTYGDRVRVRHNSTLFGLGEATVQFRKMQGALVAGLRLDNAIEMEAGKQYSIDARAGDSIIVGIQLITVPGIHRDVTFAAPLPTNSAPLKGDLVVFGEVGQVTEDLEIIDFDPQPDESVTIRGQLYAAEGIMTAETGPIPPLQSDLTPREEAPMPRIIRAEGSPDGVKVTFDVNPTRNDQVVGFTSRFRRSADMDSVAGPWVVMANLPASARQVVTPPFPEAAVPPEDSDIDGQYRIDVEIRTIMRSDKYSRPAVASGILVSKYVPPPIAFNATGVKRTAPDGSAYPAIYVECQPVIGGEIQDLILEIKQAEAPVDDYVSAGVTLPASHPFGDITGVKSGESYSVRARWRTSDNWRSDWVVDYSVQIPIGSSVAWETVMIGGRPAEEWVQDLQDMIDQGDVLSGQIEELTESVNWTAEAILAAATRQVEDRQRFEDMIHVEGTPIGTRFIQEVEQRQTDKEAFAAIFTALGAWNQDNTAWILNGQTVLVDETQSLTTFMQAQISEFEDVYSTIQTTSETLSTATEALATELHLLGAKNLAGNAFVINDGLARVSSTGQTLAQQRQGVTSEITNAKAEAIQSSQSYVDNSSAFAQVLSFLGVDAGGFVGKLNTYSQVDAAYGAKWGVAINVNGHISGVQMNNDGAAANFIIVTDNFGIISPSGTGLVQPFVITGGVAYMDYVVVRLLRAQSIVTDHIVANNISQTFSGSDNSNYQLTPNSAQVVAVAAAVQGKVTLTIYFNVACLAGESVADWRIYRDGTMLDTNQFFCRGAWGANDKTLIMEDDPPDGTYVYSLWLHNSYGNNTTLTKTRSVIVVSSKKTEV